MKKLGLLVLLILILTGCPFESQLMQITVKSESLFSIDGEVCSEKKVNPPSEIYNFNNFEIEVSVNNESKIISPKGYLYIKEPNVYKSLATSMF